MRLLSKCKLNPNELTSTDGKETINDPKIIKNIIGAHFESINTFQNNERSPLNNIVNLALA